MEWGAEQGTQWAPAFFTKITSQQPYLSVNLSGIYMALFLSGSWTFFPSLYPTRVVQNLLSHHLRWMSITACGAARLGVSHEVTSLLCCPKSMYPALSLEQSWENPSFLAKVENSRSGPRKVYEPDSSCKLTLLLLMSAHLAGSAIKLLPEGLVCADEWNGNTGFAFSLTLPLRVCPLDFSSWSLISFSIGWCISTHPLFPMRSHKLSFKGKHLNKLLGYMRIFILEEAKT